MSTPDLEGEGVFIPEPPLYLRLAHGHQVLRRVLNRWIINLLNLGNTYYVLISRLEAI